VLTVFKNELGIIMKNKFDVLGYALAVAD